MLKIISVPNPKLRLKSQPIPSITPKNVAFIRSLADTLIHKKDPAGVGLSAIQVGEPLRVFVTYIPADHQKPASQWQTLENKITVYINPTLKISSNTVSLGEQKSKPDLEGCLSIPRLYGPVWRYDAIDLDYQTFDLDSNNPQLQKSSQHFNGLAARIIQHEYDHLEGILFTDYLLGSSPASSFNPLGKIDILYLEDGNELTPLNNPKAILKW